MTVVLNSWGDFIFSGIDQMTLSGHLGTAQRTIAETPDSVLLLEGGEDVNPELYGEANSFASVSLLSRMRDLHELALIKTAIEYSVPIIGICRGHQLLAVSQGGSLYQDIYEDMHATHREYHLIRCFDKLQEFSGPMREVNSYHHQAVKRKPDHSIELAHAWDGINEGLYYTAINAISVQWHPEFIDDFDLLNWMLKTLGRTPTRFVPQNRVYYQTEGNLS